ncbi:hypothetical protein [Flavobacterium sp. DSP2-3-1]|uniref:hypothetical protein n=1 Tax=unclassified Flavobacterium TaxID=196869 RepID=UPI003CF318B5
MPERIQKETTTPFLANIRSPEIKTKNNMKLKILFLKPSIKIKNNATEKKIDI